MPKRTLQRIAINEILRENPTISVSECAKKMKVKVAYYEYILINM